MTQKKILVLGSSGFIGKNILKQLKNIYDISTWTRQSGPIEYIDMNHYDYVINCVGYYGHCRNKLIDSNINFIKDVISKIDTNKSTKTTIINFGSLGIINGHKTINNSHVNPHEQGYYPINDYEKSKAIGNSLLKTSQRIYDHNVILINPAMILGSRTDHWCFTLQRIYDKYKFIIFPYISESYISYCDINELIKFLIDLISKNITNGEYYIGNNCQINKFIKLKLGINRYFTFNKHIFIFIILLLIPVINIKKGRSLFDSTIKRNLLNSKIFIFDKTV